METGVWAAITEKSRIAPVSQSNEIYGRIDSCKPYSTPYSTNTTNSRIVGVGPAYSCCNF